VLWVPWLSPGCRMAQGSTGGFVFEHADEISRNTHLVTTKILASHHIKNTQLYMG
jgi:hypothetical protein